MSRKKPTDDEESAFDHSLTEDQIRELDARAAEDAARTRRREQSRRERAKWSALSANGFPLRAIEEARSADVTDPVLCRVAAWDAEATSILVISGGYGVGKTVAATWWAATRESPPCFLRASTFAAASRYDHDAREHWYGASALVLDDLGAEFADAKGSFQTDLDELVDVFYGDRRPLLITTNCTSTEFKSRYGGRVIDRIRESGAFWQHDGASRRGRPRQ